MEQYTQINCYRVANRFFNTMQQKTKQKQKQKQRQTGRKALTYYETDNWYTAQSKQPENIGPTTLLLFRNGSSACPQTK